MPYSSPVVTGSRGQRRTIRPRRRTGSSPIKTSTTVQKHPVTATINRPFVSSGSGGSSRPPVSTAVQPVQLAAPQPQYNPQYQGAPPSVQGATLRANADQMLSGAKNNYRGSVWQAAMNLGDQGILSQLLQDPQFSGYKAAVDPNSAFSQLQRQEDTGLKDVDEGSNAGNTFFSGLRLNDRGKVSQSANDARAQAVHEYQDALRQYAGALAASQTDYNNMYADAQQSDIDAASAIDPQNRQPDPAPAGPSYTNSQALAALRASVGRYKAQQAHSLALAEAKKKAKKKK
jgi:hypothetical protein